MKTTGSSPRSCTGRGGAASLRQDHAVQPIGGSSFRSVGQTGHKDSLPSCQVSHILHLCSRGRRRHHQEMDQRIFRGSNVCRQIHELADAQQGPVQHSLKLKSLHFPPEVTDCDVLGGQVFDCQSLGCSVDLLRTEHSDLSEHPGEEVEDFACDQVAR